MLDDSANHNLTLGGGSDKLVIFLSNNSGFYVNNTGTLTLMGNGNLDIVSKVLTLGGTSAAGKIMIPKYIAGGTGGSLLVNTAGAVTLSGQNLHNGGTTLTAGTLNINNAKALGNVVGAFTINGGTIDNSSGAAITVSYANPIVMNGDFNFAGTSDLNLNAGAVALVSSPRTITANAGILTLGGSITNGGLAKAGAGMLVLSGSNTYSGATTVNGGILKLNHANALPGGIAATGGSSALTLNGGVVELANGSFLRDLGTGVDQVQITGGISGFSAYGAARTVNFNNDAHPITWGSAAFNPATLVLNETTANNTLTVTNAIDLGSSMRTVSVNASTAFLCGMLSGAGGGLTKIGAGALTLNNTNTFSGGLTIKRGLLNMNSTNSFGLGLFTLGDSAGTNDAKLFMTSVGNSTFTNPIAITAGTSGMISMTGSGNYMYTFSGPMALSNNLSLGSTQCGFTFSGLVTESDSSALTINRSLGHGRVIFSGGIVVGTNGLTLINSNLGYSYAVDVSGGITGTGNLTLRNDTTNRSNGVTLSGAAINNIGAINNSGTNSGNVLISAALGTNVTAVAQDSASSPLTLSGVNTCAGTFAVNAGTLETTKTNCLSAASSVSIAAGAQMYLNFTGTNTIKSLKLGGKDMPKGVYGDLTLSPDYFMDGGAGALKVLIGPSSGTLIKLF